MSTVDEGDWMSIGEHLNYQSAGIVSKALDLAEIPHRIVRSARPLHDPRCWIWVPPQRAEEAQQALAECLVPDDELTEDALAYPPPDDA